MKKRKRSHSSSSSSSSSDDSDFDCDVEDFTCTPSPPTKKSQPKNANPPQTRKKLALPKATRSVRKNKNERTEKMSVNRTKIDVYDSEEDALPCKSRKNQDFEMLVEAAALHKYGGHPSVLISPSSDTNAHSDAKEETKIVDCNSEKEADNYSISEDGEDNEEDENYCADDSDELGKTSLPHLPIIFEQNKTDFIASHAKKIRSRLASQQTSSVSESIISEKLAMTINEENKAPEHSAVGSPLTERAGSVGEPNKEPGKNVVTQRKTCGKLVSASLSSKITEKFRTEEAGVRHVPLGLTGTRVLLNSNVVSSAENNSSASGCSNVPRFQTSSAPHQRVIGLSRRVRPPPLHPYLSKAEK